MVQTWCKIENSVVVQCALFDGAPPSDWPERAKWKQSDTAQIGWTYASGTFIAPPPVEQPTPSADPNDYTLNRVQFEFMLEKLGLMGPVAAAIEAMPQATDAQQNAKIAARVQFRSGQVFVRSHPLFSTLAPAVGVTSDQINAAWMQAKDLVL